MGMGGPALLIFAVIAAGLSILIFVLASWFASMKHLLHRIVFSSVLGLLAFWWLFLPKYVSPNKLTKLATAGTPVSRLVEQVGPPHAIHENFGNVGESMWFYHAGFFRLEDFGIRVDGNGKVVDWYVQ